MTYNDLPNEPVVRWLLACLSREGHLPPLSLARFEHRHFAKPPFNTSLEKRALALLAASGFSLIELKTEGGDMWSVMVKAAPVLGVVDLRHFPDLQHPPGM